MSGLSGALSLLALDMKSLGSSGGGAEVGANDGAGVRSARDVRGGGQVGRLVGRLLPPFAYTTAMATAAPTATVATAPPR